MLRSVLFPGALSVECSAASGQASGGSPVATYAQRLRKARQQSLSEAPNLAARALAMALTLVPGRLEWFQLSEHGRVGDMSRSATATGAPSTMAVHLHEFLCPCRQEGFLCHSISSTCSHYLDIPTEQASSNGSPPSYSEHRSQQIRLPGLHPRVHSPRITCVPRHLDSPPTSGSLLGPRDHPLSSCSCT